MSERRELYRSPNGDFMVFRTRTRKWACIHYSSAQRNAPSGARLSHIELGHFLRDAEGPEQQALLRLIASLVDMPPHA